KPWRIARPAPSKVGVPPLPGLVLLPDCRKVLPLGPLPLHSPPLFPFRLRARPSLQPDGKTVELSRGARNMRQYPLRSTAVCLRRESCRLTKPPAEPFPLRRPLKRQANTKACAAEETPTPSRVLQ